MKAINNQQELINFLTECINYLGTGFHPDTDFKEYIDIRNNETLYSTEQAEIYNKKMDDAFEFCEENEFDIYELSIELLNK